jgi:hypothetical protein
MSQSTFSWGTESIFTSGAMRSDHISSDSTSSSSLELDEWRCEAIKKRWTSGHGMPNLNESWSHIPNSKRMLYPSQIPHRHTHAKCAREATLKRKDNGARHRSSSPSGTSCSCGKDWLRDGPMGITFCRGSKGSNGFPWIAFTIRVHMCVSQKLDVDPAAPVHTVRTYGMVWTNSDPYLTFWFAPVCFGLFIFMFVLFIYIYICIQYIPIIPICMQYIQNYT